jgi:hypothetical protein
VAAVGAAAGYGTYRYAKGELKNTEDVSLAKGWAATQRAMKSLEFTVKTEKKDALGARMEAQRADGTNVLVTLEADGASRTIFTVRVGTIGDEKQAGTVMDAIRKAL